VKACIAYSHITIPTLESTDKQLNLFLLTAQAALTNGLIGECDSLIKAILSTMDEHFSRDVREATSLGQKAESVLSTRLRKTGELLQNMIGFLVVVPSNPENSYFQIIEAIMNFLKKEEWGTSEVAF